MYRKIKYRHTDGRSGDHVADICERKLSVDLEYFIPFIIVYAYAVVLVISFTIYKENGISFK